MRTALAIALLLLAGCDGGPAAPSAEQNRQLDEMENALDAEANRDAAR
jgi:hypothetical protein